MSQVLLKMMRLLTGLLVAYNLAVPLGVAQVPSSAPHGKERHFPQFVPAGVARAPAPAPPNHSQPARNRREQNSPYQFATNLVANAQHDGSTRQGNAASATDALGGNGGPVYSGQWPANLQQNNFPPLPPSPGEPHSSNPPLPSLEEELWVHGGSYLYRPEGDQLNWPDKEHAHYDYLRLPPDWIAPEPFTLFTDFLGAGPIQPQPTLRWPGGYHWEPRFVAAGSYEVFGTALSHGRNDAYTLGHQLVVDLDLRLTGTERFHVQFRPFGQDGTGGSYLLFDSPDDFIDNSTLEPQRYWFEGELHSIFSGYVDPFVPLDFGITVGRFAYGLHNSLLINDEIVGVVLNKNTLFLGPLSNLNLQWFYGFSEVDAFADSGGQMVGMHASADHRGVFYEMTYAFANHRHSSGMDTHFAALSRTKLYGRHNVSMRALFKWGNETGTGSGELFTIESNRVAYMKESVMGVKHYVLFCNAFVATEGWNGLGGGNLNRLRTAFEVDPLVRIAAGVANQDTAGVALGAQIFRHHDDESIIPEIACEVPGGEPVLGFGLRYLRKTSSRSFLDIHGTFHISEDPLLDREGVLGSHVILF